MAGYTFAAVKLTRFQTGAVWLGLGWVGLIWVLSSELSLSSIGLVIAALALAEVLKGILLSGWHISVNQQFDLKDAVGRVLARWVLVFLLLSSLLAVDGLPLFALSPLAVMCVAGLALTLTINDLVDIGQRSDAPSLLRVSAGSFRTIMLACTAAGFAELSPLSVDIVLLLALFLSLCVMCTKLPALPGSPALQQERTVPNAGRCLTAGAPFLLRNCDILCLPLLYTPSIAAPYLLMRVLVTPAFVVLDHFEALSAERLSGNMKAKAYKEASARINLGMLLIGGAAGLFILAGVHFGAAQQSISLLIEREVLFWLLIGLAARAVFGASYAFLETSGLRRSGLILSGIAALSFVLTLVVISSSSPVTLAMSYAISQIIFSGLAAALAITHLGVWPGLTAILLRQIKLF